MNTLIEVPSKPEILDFMITIDNYFTPPLSTRLHLPDFADKLYRNANLTCNKFNGMLISLSAIYVNKNESFLTLLAVHNNFRGKNIASQLLSYNINTLIELNIPSIKLEVYKNNTKAISFYEKFNFNIVNETEHSFFMLLKLC
ncbi:GNAT family N-acetyltransferase [Morganella morganii]|uniref:GNAT family N-acetyltransferase n=1 Tax=Morganella TaxID=581 RepID=UPI00370AFE43